MEEASLPKQKYLRGIGEFGGNGEGEGLKK